MEGTSSNYAEAGRGLRAFLIIIALLCLTAVIIVSIIRDRIVYQNQNQVAITGQGRVAYQPDIASINIGVQVDKAANAEIALNQLNSSMDQILAAVKALGIGDGDIATQNYSLYPHYDFVDNISNVAGYNANQAVIVKVRDLPENPDLVSKVVAAATKAGTNQINGISFEASNINELKQEARLLAMADAKAKAGLLADEAGVKLGKVIGWWENYISSPESGSFVADGKGGAGGTPSLPSGDHELVLEINLNYRVK